MRPSPLGGFSLLFSSIVGFNLIEALAKYKAKRPDFIGK